MDDAEQRRAKEFLLKQKIQNFRCESNITASTECRIFSEHILIILCYLVILVTFPISLFLCIKVAKEYERVVIFRLGRLLEKAKGPGIIFIIPCTDHYRMVDMRTISYEASPQVALSKDCVPVTLNSVVFYRVSNPVAAVCNVADYSNSTHLLASAVLRNEFGTSNLAVVDRDVVSSSNSPIPDEQIAHQAKVKFKI
ncbi:UNVERIFIED_CONTAM: hypothetical protein GTU68_062059 [Idotea baltica]|nr:hypothetical protein [Idotea baltica]